MPYETWPSVIKPPQDGEPVDYATTSRAHQSLSDRTEYLKRQLEDYSTKNGRVMLQSVLLEADVNIGDVVYYDGSSKSYGRALAEGVVDGNTGLLSATKRSFAIGMCVSRSGNYGDILISGSSNLMEDFLINPANLFDISSTYDETGTRAYLSNLTPGKLSQKPISPLIQVGFFSSEKSFIVMLQKDIFESHLHYRFPISMSPASSQNRSMSGIIEIGGVDYVDYFDGDLEGRPNSDIVVSIKQNNNISSRWDVNNPARVEIRPRDGKMEVTIVYSGLVKNDSSSGSSSDIYRLDWPNYGEWVDIVPVENVNDHFPTNLSLSFSRVSGLYTDNTFAQDIAAGDLILPNDVWKFYLPDDLFGWTNANHKTLDTPVNSRYRFVHESIASLNSIWPPTPLESTLIETNGVHRIRNVEFSPTMFGIHWISGTPPWTWTGYDLPNNEDPKSFLYFSKTSLENSRSVVLSLGSNSPMISVVDCFSGEPSNAGHLRLGLDLSLNEDPNIVSSYVGLSSISSINNKFKRSTIVSEIVAGTGISITKLGSTGGLTANCGKLRIDRAVTKLEGAIEVVSLLNAKEELINDMFSAIVFPKPSTGKYKMVSRVKIPNYDIVSETITLKLLPLVFGTAAGGAYNSVFDLYHYIVRTGTSMGNALAAQPYQLVIPMPSAPYVINSDEPLIEISSGLLQPGDQLYTTWERVSTGMAGLITDTYNGSVGFSQVRWEIDA